MSRTKSQSISVLLIAITLLSFLLRVWGIQFGLPFAYHPDEQQYIFPGIGFVSGDFRPWAYFNPTLYPYFIGLVYSFTYWGLRSVNAFPTFFDLSLGWSEPMLPWVTGTIYLARYTSVAVGVLTTLTVYQLGRWAYSQTTGVAAAIIFGFTFLPAREAHFAVSDAPVALGVAVTLYLSLKIIRRGQGIDYLWVGLAVGLSTATKYSAALLILPLGVAHLVSQRYHNWPQRLSHTWLVVMAGIAAVVSYLAISPYTLLDWKKFLAHFGENLQSARTGFQGLDLDPAGGAIFYLKSLIWGFGWPLFLLFMAAVPFALWRRRRVDLVLVILPLFGFLYMQRQAMYFARWLTPFLPAMAVLAAETVHFGVKGLISLAKRDYFRLVRTTNLSLQRPEFWVIMGTVLLLTLPSTYVASRADYIFSQQDTRTQALDWVRQNIPPGSTIAAELLSPPWGPPLAMPGLEIGTYNFAPTPAGGIAEVEFQQFRDWQVQYVIASSYYYARPLLDKAHQAKLKASLQTLDANAELLVEFQPYSHHYDGFFYHDQVYGPANDTLYRKQPGPIIRIYRLP